MFTENQLIWATLVLGAITAIVASMSSAAFPQAVAPKPVPTETIRPKLYMILPPAEYDHFYDGDLTIKIVPDLISLRAACGTDKETMLACAMRNAKGCVIYMVEDRVMRERGWNTGLLLRHEIGHCNGWPGDHPGQRPVSWPLTHFI